MILGKIYEYAVKNGMEADPRGKELKQELYRVKDEFNRLSNKEKEEFDAESLWNPYADTRILYGDKKRQIKRILVGIDIEVGELLLADRLGRDKRIDLVISHHPQGAAWASFYEVMHMQVDILAKLGIPVNVAEDLLNDRIREVERKVMPANHFRTVDVARLLNIPFMCIHTPTDNLVAQFLNRLMEKNKPRLLEDIVSLLKKLPEYKESSRQKSGPKIIIGEPKRRAGRIFLEMTGGTEGSKDIFERLSQIGIGTIVSMHLSEEHFKNVKIHHINVICAGHIASDTLGLNLLIDKLQKQDKSLEVVACSGFRRIKR